MKLPIIGNLFAKKTPSEYFLALLFRDEKIHAVVFEQVHDSIQIISEGKSLLPTALEQASVETLLKSADEAISIAEESLPDGVTTHKTVYGVKETWVEDTHITKDYLSKLKTISDQLDLQPIGFLVLSEAIAHLLQKEEGAPVSAILVETGKRQLYMTLLRAGRIIATKEISLEEDIAITIEHALARFDNVEILPSRIILFDSGDKEAEKKLLRHKWSKTLPFLHVPQITTLPSDFDTRAILFGTATQMGLTAIDVIKKPVEKHEALFEEEPARNASHSDAGGEESNNPLPEGEGDQGNESLMEVTGEDTSEYFGFVKNADIAESATPAHESPLAEKDIESVTKEIPDEEAREEELTDSAFGFGLSGPTLVEGAKKIARQFKRFVPQQFSLLLGRQLQQLLTHIPKEKGGKRNLFFIVPGVLLVCLLLFVWYIFGTHAKVILFLTPQVISKDQTISFTTTGNTNVAANTVSAQTISVTEEGKESGDATGTKDIGNPAKGTVTIFNSDNSSHTLSSGTTITSSNGLKFTLDKDVTVASGSSDPTNLTAGTADVPVTAADIGTDYNLPSNTKFSVSGTAVLAGKNASAFSGGTKTSEVVVSQKDLDNLTQQLTDSLKDKAKSDLTGKIDSGSVLLPDFTKTTVGTTNFDKKVGDQSKTINLDETIVFTTIFYKKSDIESFSKQALLGQIPDNMTLSSDGVEWQAKNITTKGDITSADLTMKASLIPKIDTKSISQQIAGKSFTQAKDILSSIPQFSDSTVILSPNLFFLPKVLPRLSGNITIQITSHE